ncbi:MAG: hypothetical protein EPO08_13005 [Rhodospirillaceae bacterium]|nr:MAG: hypothetical protein EPO08_13005 [Rhodospirillaceae bacterium]
MQPGLFQTQSPSTSPYLRDPKVLPLYDVPSANLKINSLTAGAALSNFWGGSGGIAQIGDYQTADPSTATRTIVNVSGRGRLTGLIGGTSNAGSTTWTITIDGTVYTLTHAGMVAGQRSIVGDITRIEPMYTTAANGQGYTVAQDLSTRGSNSVSISMRGATLHQVINPVLSPLFVKFDSSLLVQIAMSTINADATAAYAGVIWKLDS